MVFKIKIPLFDQTAIVLVTPTERECKKYNIDLITDGSRATAYSHGVIAFWMKVKDITPGVVAHEVYHSANFLCNFLGIKYSQDSEEIYAYIIHHLVNEIHKKLKKRK